MTIATCAAHGTPARIDRSTVEMLRHTPYGVEARFRCVCGATATYRYGRGRVSGVVAHDPVALPAPALAVAA